MTTTQIIWTALPNGFDDSYYYFSICVSHRLTGGPSGILTDYPLGPPSDPTNWAATAAALSVQVSFGAGLVAAERLSLASSGARFWADVAPNVWTLVFPSTTAVDSFVPQQPSLRALRTYGATAITKQHETLYGALAVTAGADYPLINSEPVSDFVAALGDFPALLTQLEGLAAAGSLPPGGPALNDPAYPLLVSAIQNHYGAASAAVQAIAVEHYFAYRFYRRSTASQYGSAAPSAVTALPVPAKPPFHALVGMLADHPTLLRNLGLVLDYRVSQAALPAAPAAEGALSLSVQWNGSAQVNNQFPQTLYRINANGFFARESDSSSDLQNGLLILTPTSPYSVVQMDPDGAAQKLIAYGISAAGAATRNGPSAIESLPARRTGGLTVLRQGRALSLGQGFARGDTNNANLAANVPVVLDSSDVCRGFRVDVLDTTVGIWRSLCQRIGADVVGGTPFPLASADEEGWVVAASGSRGAPDGSADEQNSLYVHEAVFGWDGWSLAARRPGRTVGHEDGDPNQTPVVGFLPNRAPPGYPIVSNYRVTPGTLPKLRFGRIYFFRVRTADLAGNGLSSAYQANTVDLQTASAPATYLRYEPVAAPTLVLLQQLTPGESLETLVIRSNPDPVDDLTKIALGSNVASYSATLEAQAAGLSARCVRHVAPPKTSQIMAELHGMLDPPMTAIEAYRISAKESGTFFDTSVYDIDTGESQPLPDGEVVFVPGPAPAPGDPPMPGQYVLHQLPTLTLPYLPDPMADGLALTFPALPMTAPSLDPALAPTVTLSYAVDPAGWPRVTPLQLAVVEAAGGLITYSSGSAAMTVGLPPATEAVVRASSSPSASRIQLTAIGSALGANPAAMSAALQGGNWMLSPYRPIKLVHAVLRPLLIPSLSNMSLTRSLGQTFALPVGAVNVDGRSTGLINLAASWTDPVDDPANPSGPATVDRAGLAVSFAVDYADVITKIQPDGAGASTRRHEFGDTIHRWVNYRPDAVTRYQEYFPASIVSDSSQLTTKGAEQIFNVLASRRPDPLKVLYVLPTFKWTTSPDGSTLTRTGRGIRIYFERPWFSSGADELVGVLTTPGDGGFTSPALLNYVSQWGRDPLWSSYGFAQPLGVSDFTNALALQPQPTTFGTVAPPLSTGPFPLAEDATLMAGVVAFQPEYNADRALWFVDIEMDSGDSYFPFVRLALARYQPHAIDPEGPDSQHLSLVVRTEVLALAPDRTAAVSFGTNGTIRVTVSGVAAHNRYAELAGLTPPTSTAATAVYISLQPIPVSQSVDPTVAGGHVVTALLQQRPHASNNDLLWAPVGAPVQLASYAEAGYVLWAGTVTLPAAAKGSSSDYRLLIREVELHSADRDTADGSIAGFPYAERLVYAAALPINA